jgi:hypothetical protein
LKVQAQMIQKGALCVLLLMKDDLRKVAEVIHFGRRTLRMIQFNIGFALRSKPYSSLGRTRLRKPLAGDSCRYWRNANRDYERLATFARARKPSSNGEPI